MLDVLSSPRFSILKGRRRSINGKKLILDQNVIFLQHFDARGCGAFHFEANPAASSITPH